MDILLRTQTIKVSIKHVCNEDVEVEWGTYPLGEYVNIFHKGKKNDGIVPFMRECGWIFNGYTQNEKTTEYLFANPMTK